MTLYAVKQLYTLTFFLPSIPFPLSLLPLSPSFLSSFLPPFLPLSLLPFPPFHSGTFHTASFGVLLMPWDRIPSSHPCLMLSLCNHTPPKSSHLSGRISSSQWGKRVILPNKMPKREHRIWLGYLEQFVPVKINSRPRESYFSSHWEQCSVQQVFPVTSPIRSPQHLQPAHCQSGFCHKTFRSSACPNLCTPLVSIYTHWSVRLTLP